MTLSHHMKRFPPLSVLFPPFISSLAFLVCHVLNQMEDWPAEHRQLGERSLSWGEDSFLEERELPWRGRELPCRGGEAHPATQPAN
ncbi:hypothetical protein BDV25DRAFT_159314, partial [Aspergillus avenaceus]